MREIWALTSPHCGGGSEPKNRNLRLPQPSERGVGAGAPKLGALTLNRRLRAARPAASGDGLLQTGALGVLRQRNVAR